MPRNMRLWNPAIMARKTTAPNPAIVPTASAQRTIAHHGMGPGSDRSAFCNACPLGFVSVMLAVTPMPPAKTALRAVRKLSSGSRKGNAPGSIAFLGVGRTAVLRSSGEPPRMSASELDKASLVAFRRRLSSCSAALHFEVFSPIRALPPVAEGREFEPRRLLGGYSLAQKAYVERAGTLARSVAPACRYMIYQVNK